MAYKFHILLLNGPNLNLLGIRETDKYGDTNLPAIVNDLTHKANQHNVKLIHLQSNSEGELIDCIQSARSNNIDYIIINAAAFTHTSIALRDALLAVKIPFIEVHLSNIYARELFRNHSYLSDISEGIICGLGSDGYIWALETAIKRLLNSY
ncbi:type II 3-dehydroquinate dehydratase [Candidatus Pantoea carbekii]|uniref:3-dehydroquinate dehydratase n=1 Tax=Candidatus Pantoea carbekii TaxID=1235990 RepID=U3U795_9GAMM|nr:type II 3-dehydroquinate dehydratase [Candidatus Pantoea carbekii]AKC32505.1 3-dehydroquinate dehydratase [Candidatus Pantoea carbekii]BAO00232.1 3-dehydroquinate dehydratase [Candidatus Pantoea carbekii]